MSCRTQTDGDDPDDGAEGAEGLSVTVGLTLGGALVAAEGTTWLTVLAPAAGVFGSWPTDGLVTVAGWVRGGALATGAGVRDAGASDGMGE
jgi:hypothetical protein